MSHMIVICKRKILKFYPFLIIKIGTFIIELNIDNDRGTDTRSFCPGDRSRGYGDADSLYGWQIDHIVPQSLLRDRGFGESMIRERILRSIKTVETRETLRGQADLKAFAGSIRVDEGQLYGSAEG